MICAALPLVVVQPSVTERGNEKPARTRLESLSLPKRAYAVHSYVNFHIQSFPRPTCSRKGRVWLWRSRRHLVGCYIPTTGSSRAALHAYTNTALAVPSHRIAYYTCTGLQSSCVNTPAIRSIHTVIVVRILVIYALAIPCRDVHVDAES